MRAIELPLNFENQAFFGKPAVAPLLWELDEHEPYLVALVDQEKARFFLAQLGTIGFEDSVELDIEDYDWVERTTMHGPGPGIENAAVHGGTGKDDFKKMIDEHVSRFYRETAERIGKLCEKHGAARIILGGVEESAHAVEGYMPDATKKRVIDIAPIPLRSTLAQMNEIAQERALAYERAEELDLVNQVIDFAKSGGRGAIGPKAVMEALEMQRVEVLIMPWPMDDPNLAAELPLRAFASGGTVELVHGQAADRLKQEGGLAARLYYAL
jgi:peptide subunit release factor 1 (eRF1)